METATPATTDLCPGNPWKLNSTVRCSACAKIFGRTDRFGRWKGGDKLPAHAPHSTKKVSK